MRPNHGAHGHRSVSLVWGEKHRRALVHRLVLEAFVGPCPDKHEGCHYDGNPDNNVLENLRWDTRKENARDRERHNRTLRGERHPLSVVTEEDVRRIRKMDMEGDLKRSRIVELICEEKKCYPKTVWNIIYRKTWKHVV